LLFSRNGNPNSSHKEQGTNSHESGHCNVSLPFHADFALLLALFQASSFAFAASDAAQQTRIVCQLADWHSDSTQEYKTQQSWDWHDFNQHE
jgi:hypothetical protein